MLYFYEDVTKGKDLITMYSNDGIYTVRFHVRRFRSELPLAWGVYEFKTLKEADEKFRELYAQYFFAPLLALNPQPGPRLSVCDTIKDRKVRESKKKLAEERRIHNARVIAKYQLKS